MFSTKGIPVSYTHLEVYKGQITFNPLEIANNMKKSGGFIPGIRPGKPTVEYLTKIVNYIIFIGACGLVIVQVIPYFFNGVFGANVSFGGTSLIIIVGVVLETMKQIESQMPVSYTHLNGRIEICKEYSKCDINYQTN